MNYPAMRAELEKIAISPKRIAGGYFRGITGRAKALESGGFKMTPAVTKEVKKFKEKGLPTLERSITQRLSARKRRIESRKGTGYYPRKFRKSDALGREQIIGMMLPKKVKRK